MPLEGPIVTNTGPLIALAGISRLDLLPALFREVLAPAAVVSELLAGGDQLLTTDVLRSASWLSQVTPAHPVDPLLGEALGAGEAQAITLALERSAVLLLLDDRRARRIATAAYGLKVRGAAGVLVDAKRAGLVERVRPLLLEMRSHGYYISNRVIEAAARTAGEA